MVSIEEILQATDCEEIFNSNILETKNLYKQLVKAYHPDVNNDVRSTEAFQKIQTLYQMAVDKIKSGIWQEENVLTIRKENGAKAIFNYLTVTPFELGNIYVGKTHILYLLESNHEKYFNNAIKMINHIKYDNKKMEKEFSSIIPSIVDSFKSGDNKYIIVIKKNANEFMLSSAIEVAKEKFTDRHVAWIMSRLNSLNCFLQYNDMVLNGFDLNSCFINPITHQISLYGGWWYARYKNGKMIGTTKSIYMNMPLKNKTEKIALHTTDMESIRQLGREILYNKGTAPKPLLNWLNKGSSEDAYAEFSYWNNTLDKAYGERKFVNLDIKYEDIYKI